ncbi:MAG: hypothetical protein ACJ8BC_00095 [Gemmatimonadales bacterium]
MSPIITRLRQREARIVPLLEKAQMGFFENPTWTKCSAISVQRAGSCGPELVLLPQLQCLANQYGPVHSRCGIGRMNRVPAALYTVPITWDNEAEQ